MTSELVVYIGCDPREPRGIDVCKKSIRLAASAAGNEPPPMVELTLELAKEATGHDFTEPGASTTFTRTRFLTPWLAREQFPDARYALFCDCDFLFTRDVHELAGHANGAAAVVQMDSLGMYRSMHGAADTTKMDGKKQEGFPKKWWSALMLYDLKHRALDFVEPGRVAGLSVRYWHRFWWLQEEQLGSLPPAWHWVDGYSCPCGGLPAGIHYTRGTPELGWDDTLFAYIWRAIDAIP